VKRHKEKERKEKYSKIVFLFICQEERVFNSWKRVKLKLDLAWYYNTMEKRQGLRR